MLGHNSSNSFLRFDNLWTQAKHIPGHITKHEGLLLYTLSKQYSAIGDILEIGPYHGRSSLFLGKGVQEAKQERTVLCVDNFSKTSSTSNPTAKDPRQGFIRNMQEHGLDDVVTLLEGDGAEVMATLQASTYGLIFIDGDHTKKQISREVPEALRILHQQGVLILHDYKNPAIEPAYSDWIDRNIRKHHNTIFVQDSTPTYGGNGLLIVTPTT